ncbi:invasion associated locus B family protein [Martelella sp. HB161492]|uniref:invasion associated locus B family protein n=1 Tax=Martelella sp. HB161492 TaxID=2720726 RepID=UPI0015913FB9|nr:invasion associated locus B family protein [Martelella sp. HB161492]
MRKSFQFLAVMAFGSIIASTTAFADDDVVSPSDITVAYGDWQQHCMLVQIQKQGEADPAAPQRVCEVTQTLNMQQKDGQTQRLLTIAVGKLPMAELPRVVVQTPSGVDLRKGVTLTLGEADPEAAKTPKKGGAVTAEADQIELTFVTCGQVCTADRELTAEEFAELKSTDAASITFQSMNGQAIKAPLSLKGFAAAIAAKPPVE